MPREAQTEGGAVWALTSHVGLCSYQLHGLLRKKKTRPTGPPVRVSRTHLEQVGLVLAWPWPRKHGDEGGKGDGDTCRVDTCRGLLCPPHHIHITPANPSFLQPLESLDCYLSWTHGSPKAHLSFTLTGPQPLAQHQHPGLQDGQCKAPQRRWGRPCRVAQGGSCPPFRSSLGEETFTHSFTHPINICCMPTTCCALF